MRLYTEHVLCCGAERLWRLMFDPSFDKEHAMKANRVRRHEVLSCSTTEATWHIRSRSTPSAPIPKFLAKWAGTEFSFETTLQHAANSNWGEAMLRPSLMPERFSMQFRIELVPELDTRCRRRMDWQIEFRSLGQGIAQLVEQRIGQSIERFIASEILQGLDASAHFIDTYCQKTDRLTP